MKILIVGCGRVGSGIARVLLSQNHKVAIVDKDPQTFERLGKDFTGQTFTGVGFDHDVLIKMGIEQADALAAVTTDDDTNIVAARIAKEIFHVPRVVARLYDVRQAEIYRRLGLQTIAPTEWGIHRIADLLLYSPLDTVYGIGSGDVELLVSDVPNLMVGKTVRDLTVTGEIHVVSITRANKTFLPTLGTILQKDDLLHLAVLTSSAGRLREILGV
ncbi:MAG: TrkA family potassium uptake protein [Flexilinea sp.]